MLQLTLVAFYVTVVVSNLPIACTTLTNNAHKNDADSSGDGLPFLIRQKRQEIEDYPKMSEAFQDGPQHRHRRASSDSKSSGNFSCSQIHCQFVPTDATCSIVDKSDMSISHPKGPKAACCPLYKCLNKDGSYFPFHGAFGKGPAKTDDKKSDNKFNGGSKSVDGSGGSSSNFSCSSISCQFPPNDATCSIVDKSDTTVSRPKGQKASCCPLYKCKDNKDGSNFPFHGAFGRGPAKEGSKEATTSSGNVTKTTPPKKEESFSCSSVNCKSPPMLEAKCTMLDPGDNSLARPKGKNSTCCPMFRCEMSDGSYFPFHGAFGKGPMVSSSTKTKTPAMTSNTSATSTSGGDCDGIKCKSVPTDSDCAVVNVSDTSIQRPKGKTANCCPLYKCTNKDGSYFPFHGIHGKGPTKQPSPSAAKLDDNFSCNEIHCQFPPNDAKCSLHDKSDNSIQMPKGKKATCCPLHKCVNDDGSYFPFHGAFGKGPVKGGSGLSTPKATTTPPPITTPRPTTTPFSPMMMPFTFPTIDFGMGMFGGSTKSTTLGPSGSKGTTVPESLFKDPVFPSMDFSFPSMSMDMGMGMNMANFGDSSKSATTTPTPRTTTTLAPSGQVKTTTIASLFTEPVFPSMDFSFPSMSMDMGMGMNMANFGNSSKGTTTTPSPPTLTTSAPSGQVKTTTPASLFTEPVFPSMDFSFPSMSMDMGMGTNMANFGDSSKGTTTPSPPTLTTSAPSGQVKTTTPASLFKEPVFPSMDFSFPSMSMDMGIGMNMGSFGESSNTSTPTPIIKPSATPASLVKQPDFPSMDFPSMDFSMGMNMGNFGTSASSSSTSSTTPSSAFPKMDMPSMDFSMMGMDMKMPSMDFPAMTSMTPSTNKTGDTGNVSVMNSVDKGSGNVEINVVSTGNEDAVAFATDGGEASEADIAAMQKEMDAMTAQMNNMMG